MAELGWEPSIDAAHIGVAANAGVVTLTGHVQSFAQKVAAERAAARVKGVKAVAEEIEVKLPYDIRRGDEDIAGAAIERLAWDSSVPSDAVEIRVEKGWVTLNGEVDWQFQKEAADAGSPNSDRRHRHLQSDRDQADRERRRCRPKHHARAASFLVLRSEHDQGQHSGRQDQADRASHDLECARPGGHDRVVGAGRDIRRE